MCPSCNANNINDVIARIADIGKCNKRSAYGQVIRTQADHLVLYADDNSEWGGNGMVRCVKCNAVVLGGICVLLQNLQSGDKLTGKQISTLR